MQLARDFTDVSTYAFQIFKSQTVAVQIALSFFLSKCFYSRIPT